MANAYDNPNDALRVVTINAATGQASTSTAEQRGDGAANLGQGGVSASGAGLTITLPAPAAGLFHYITNIQIVAYAAAATAGAATPVTVTSTNFPGNEAWTFPTAIPIGEVREQRGHGNRPTKAAVAATATTIVCPATTGIIWRANVDYFVA